MIYTVTFNPSLDYVIQVDDLTLGEINRTTKENIYPGGKGNNVSVVLSNLGHKSRALGFKAGFIGDQLEAMLNDFGCDTDFVPLENGMTRINVKVKSTEESEINGQGPAITKEALDELFGKLDKLGKGDVLVLAGSIPNTLPEDIYERIMEKLDGRDIQIVVDATKDLLLNVLKYHPFLIKPNNHELGEMFGVKLQSDDEIVLYAKKLQEKGARNVLVSMAGDGAILVTEDGMVEKTLPPKGQVVNSVGAGDSMVAGFLTGYLNTGDYKKALQLGTATGSASAFVSWLATKEEITALLTKPASEYGL
ncbi:1-phosphofructokinase [Hespellia stercorisuis]|uniref:Tagatose-6-phosphate kinase n=1 Tax=Hespellia stercorisuis DSM 15480 TaxID=1121950 RepID=A0A1M6HV75_9FIRM|nr:1-phosphofructokinase [Hespellia stercorisuis]SHJ26028.1 fructose-1-phosphate kinase [Hespellia stercorisuis DSM 15480]